jgi:hypothetical protein
MRKNKKKCETFKGIFLKQGDILKPRQISSWRYYVESSEIGTYFNSFEHVLRDFNKEKLKNLTLIDFDEKEMTLTMFIDYEGFKNIKRIWQMYLDGTFKTRFFRGSHYNILVIEINLTGWL